MFSEILKINPRLDESDLGKMDRALSSRFASVAKRFGSGLVSAIKGGGITGLAIGLIDKLLNPLEAVQATIERSLQKGDQLATFAKQFGTSSGNLARLQAFGKATGLDEEGVNILLGKFQSAVTQAAANPSQPTAVSNFVGQKDTAEAFFEFIQSLQKLTPTQQNFVQQEVFGEKQILKASSFLHADFQALAKIIGGPGSDQLSASIDWTAKLQENRQALAARRDLQDIVTKSRKINDSTINGLEAKDELDLNQENRNLGKFDSLKAISIENQKLINLAVNEFLKLAPIVAKILPVVVSQLTGTAQAVENSRAARGMTGEKEK